MGRKPVPLGQKSVTKRHLSEMTQDQAEFFLEHLPWIKESTDSDGADLEKRIDIFGDIIRHNPDGNPVSLMKRYLESDSLIEKIEIRRKKGSEFSKNLTEAALRRDNSQILSVRSIEHHTKKGKTLEEAKEIVAGLQRSAAKAHHSKAEDYRILNPLCPEYWEARNLPDGSQEARIRSGYHHRKDVYIERHGEQAWNDLVTLRGDTTFARHGYRNPSHSVSRESIRFFRRLYESFSGDTDTVRTLEFIGADFTPKEWFIWDTELQTVYFYDLVIKEIDLIVEYHGTYWHPREIHEWKRPDHLFDIQKLRDARKRALAEEKGFKVVTVWSDDDHDKSIMEIKRIAETRLDSIRRF